MAVKGVSAARPGHSPILPLHSGVSAAQSSPRQHGINREQQPERGAVPANRSSVPHSSRFILPDLLFSHPFIHSLIYSFIPAAPALPAPGSPGTRSGCRVLRGRSALGRPLPALQPRSGIAPGPPGSAPQNPLEKTKHARLMLLGVWDVLGSLSVNEIGSKEAKSPSLCWQVILNSKSARGFSPRGNA